MKVLITGARGQIGHALVKSAPEGMTVKALTRTQLNITREREVADCVRFHKPDVIVNAAAYTDVDHAESTSDTAWSINSDGPRYLAQSAHSVGARMIHLSTDFVFDGASSRPYAPYARTNPLSVYGESKRDGEDAVLEVLGERAVILRTGWIYAATGRNFVHTILRIMRSTSMSRVVADQIGTPTSAASVAEVIWKLIATPEIYGIHHWTDAGAASRYDFAVAIAEEATLLGLLPQEPTVIPITTSEYPSPARRPAFSALDTSSLAVLNVGPVHWRKRLRGVLQEIGEA
jgi:dTDP-4-dehydrorhamnose reductase